LARSPTPTTRPARPRRQSTSPSKANASQCILALQTIHSRRVDTKEPSVLTLGTINGGDRRNVIAETINITGTLRTFSEAITDQYEKQIRQTLEGCTSAMGATFDFNLKRGNIPMLNSPALNQAAIPVIEKALGPNTVIAQGPGLFGEDFSAFQRVIPGSMFFLGTANPAKGITAGVHTAEFDIDEDALSIGVNTGSRILLDYLTRNAK
jgi:amidohydrolase